MIKIVTTELERTNLISAEFSNKIVVDAQEKEALINHMLNIKKDTQTIEIWDLTKGYDRGTIIDIADHINKTGSNPLIGNQQKLGIDFLDISNLYLREQGVVTSCYGNRFSTIHKKNSSTWLCHISIVARAIGIENISGKLISL